MTVSIQRAIKFCAFTYEKLTIKFLHNDASVCVVLRSSSGIFGWKCDNVGFFRRNRRECYTLRLSDAVLAAQVAIGFHSQRAAVFVSKPPGNGRNVHAAFDAARCELDAASRDV